jgi:hypothetical protein
MCLPPSYLYMRFKENHKQKSRCAYDQSQRYFVLIGCRILEKTTRHATKLFLRHVSSVIIDFPFMFGMGGQTFVPIRLCLFSFESM